MNERPRHFPVSLNGPDSAYPSADALPRRELLGRLGPLLLALLVLLALNLWGAWLMNGARGFVAGESLWSKAQRDAIDSLQRYADSRHPADLDTFSRHLRIPAGDRKAREALMAEVPDTEAARLGFLEGGNHEDDIPAMIWILRHLAWEPAIARALQAWAEGDALIGQLAGIGERLRATVVQPAPNAARRQALLAELGGLNERLTLLEQDFSGAIGEASRDLALALKIANITTCALLLAFGTLQSVQMVTRRRRAEYAARRFSERLELATTGANDGIWDWLIGQKELNWTARVRELLGYPDDEEFSGFQLREQIHPEDVTRTSQAVRRHFAGESDRFDHDLRLRRRDGTYRWFRLRGMAIRDALGQPLRMLGTISDIHENVMANRALQAAWTHSQQVADELELALDGANVALWAYDPTNGQILHYRRWKALLGRDEMPSSFDGWLQLTHPDDRAQRLRLLREHLDNRTRYYESEFRMQHAQGHWVWVRSRGRATERDASGQALQYAGAVMNINEQVAAREIEQREQAFLRAMIEGVDVGVMVSDMDRVVYINTAFCRLLGYRQPDELAGMALARLMPPQERSIDLANREKAASGMVLPLRVVRLLSRSGGRVKVVSNLSAVDWNGRPHFISTASALAEHTVLETQLRALSDRFQRAMLSELEGQQASIARELHDSLGSVLAGVSLLLGGARAATADDRVAGLIERSQGEVKVAAEMTRAMSRGIMPVGAHPGAFTQAIEQFASDLGQLKGVACNVEAQGNFSDLPSEMGNHVFRIIQEATTNAIKHGRATEIEILLAETRGDCAVAISDNGTGFDVAAIESSHPGMGVKSMRARAKAIGASLRIQRGARAGCRVNLSWSMRARRDRYEETEGGPGSD